MYVKFRSIIAFTKQCKELFIDFLCWFYKVVGILFVSVFLMKATQSCLRNVWAAIWMEGNHSNNYNSIYYMDACVKISSIDIYI